MSLFKRDQDQEKKWNGLRSNQKITVLQYDEAVYEQLRKDDVNHLQIDLPTPDHDLKLNLVKNEIFADGFFVSTDKEKSVNYTGGLHYKGQIEGQPGSIVAISFFDNEVIAVINETDGNKYVVGQSSALRRGSFAVYNTAEVDAPAIGCLSESLPGYSDYVNQIKMPTALEQRAAGGCVNIYFELGQSVFSNKGGTAGATNYITGAFNTVSALYAADGVTVKISQVFVWTTAEPYAADASNALTQFGQARKLNFNGNLAQMVRLKTGGAMSGIAWLNVLCSSASSSGAGPFSYAEILPTVSSLPTFSWTAEVITHELGHNLGSPHTQSCSWSGGPIDNCVAQEGSCAPGPTPVGGGTIMSYCHLTSIGINFSKGFGPLPKALILSRISASSCIVACSGGSTCVSPTGLTTTNITTSGATLSWTPVSGAISYSIDYKPSISTTWTTVNSVGTASSVVLSGLSAGTLYNWQVKTNCAVGSSTSTQSQLTTSSTASNCTSNPPAGLFSSSITSNTAMTTWSPSTGATSYSYYIKVGTTNPTWYLVIANFTGTELGLTSLMPGTFYTWKISANCTAGSSAFTEGQFTTLTSTNCTSSPPTGLTTTSISTVSAILNWNPVSTATTYAVQYKLNTSATWITLIANTTSTSISLTGLLSGLLYDWQVRSNCSAGSSAFAASSFTSTAATGCTSPVTLTTTNITGTTCTVNWSAVSGAFNYTLEMKEASDVNWSQLTVTSATAVNISSLTAGRAYDWRVKTNCSGSSSGYAQTQFTTTGTPPVTCNAPTSLTSSTITTSTATLAWVAGSGALNYSVEYKVNTSSQWVVANASLAATTFLLSNLTSSTIYDWRIKTNCSSTSSAYSTAQFTTGTVSNACPGTLDLTENGTIATAKPVPFNVDIKGQINPSGDMDYYSFVISKGGTIIISLTTLPADFDLRILNSTGTTSLGVSQNGGTISESITTSLSPGKYYIRVYGWSGATSSNCYTLRLQPTTASIESQAGIYYNPDALSTSVYPNPTTTSLNYRILGLTGPAELTVTDLQGRNVMTAYTKESTSQLDVSNLSAGFYFLKVRDENNRSNVVKFMKTL
ncbi:MAG: fibronectin type III domain-containing protein [Saprospiraceae bacterium]